MTHRFESAPFKEMVERIVLALIPDFATTCGPGLRIDWHGATDSGAITGYLSWVPEDEGMGDNEILEMDVSEWIKGSTSNTLAHLRAERVEEDGKEVYVVTEIEPEWLLGSPVTDPVTGALNAFWEAARRCSAVKIEFDGERISEVMVRGDDA